MPDTRNGQFHKNAAQLTRLAAAQIRVAVSESTDNVNSLSVAFTEIVNQDKQIRKKIEQLPPEPEIEKIKKQIEQLSVELRANVDNAIIAFQFYDRLCQRLDHTSTCLKKLSEIEDHNLQSSAEEVMELRDNVYNHFTMIEERQLFDAVLTNKDFEDAINEYSISRAESQDVDEGDVELF